MPLQIANPTVVDKVARLAAAAGLTKTALVEKAVDSLARDMAKRGALEGNAASAQWAALLDQLRQVPDRVDAVDATPWDAAGLPL